MLKLVRDPDGRETVYEYDALGRRIAKITGDSITRYIWNEHVILHEWSYPLAQRPQLVVTAAGGLSYDRSEPISDNLATWVYDPESYTPSAKLVRGQQYTIISDYLGTPTHAFDNEGKKVWECELDIYGKVRKITGERYFVPFRYQGQYEDAETGLYYNRFRYYDPESGEYISKDPIGLNGGLALYNYVQDVNVLLDILGLSTVYLRNKEYYVGKAKVDAKTRYGKSNYATDIFKGIPDTHVAQGWNRSYTKG